MVPDGRMVAGVCLHRGNRWVTDDLQSPVSGTLRDQHSVRAAEGEGVGHHGARRIHEFSPEGDVALEVGERLDALRVVVGDGDAEFFLDLEYEPDEAEGVDAAGTGRDFTNPNIRLAPQD